MMSRPLLSIAMEIHEPSSASEVRTSSTLKPGGTVRLSAEVACADFNGSPHGSFPTLPRLTALTQLAGPATELCQVASLTIVSRRRAGKDSSSRTSTPATELSLDA